MIKKVTSLHLVMVIMVISMAAVLLLLGTASTMASAPQEVDAPQAGPPPTMVNYQGTLREDGALYEGTGYFKFAIVNSAGTTNYWAHDGTSSGEPGSYISLTVTNGLFNVLLGDTSITNMTQPIADTVFSETNTFLRVWFSDTTSGFQVLTPDQQFASVAYALRCEYAESYTETDPVFKASAAFSINSTMINNWNSAYNWLMAGYDKTDDSWADNPSGDVHTSSNVGIGTSSPGAALQIDDSSSPLLVLNALSSADASQVYVSGSLPNFYEVGLHGLTGNYLVSNGVFTANSSQGDGSTMLLAHPSGILDFNNQSRARGWLSLPQIIPHATWTKIEFDMVNFDQQGEFIPGNPGIPGRFIAREEGYYQVHARTAYEYNNMEPPPMPHPMGHVSIRIVVTGSSGTTIPVAQGNNLMMLVPIFGGDWLEMLMNNAPNVSDVVYLNPGDILEIEAWQDIDMNIFNLVSLYFGTDQTYVSIHKDS